MDDTSTNQIPPAGAPASPAGGGDVTALQARIEELQRAVNEHKEGRAGAQRIANQREAELKAAQEQLNDANQLMDSLQKNLDAKSSVEAQTQAQLQELQAQAAAAQRKATVLELAGKSAPNLVPLLAEGLLNVAGESPEEIATSIGTVAQRLSEFTKAIGAGHQEPGTAPPPPDSQRPPVPTTTDKAARIKELVMQKGEIADNPMVTNFRSRLREIDAEIAELQKEA